MCSIRAALVAALVFACSPLTYGQSTGNARVLYATHCADCHELGGRGIEYRHSGISIPDFTSRSWMKAKSRTRLRLSILLGQGSEMPAFEDEISEAEADLLARYVASFSALKHVSMERPQISAVRELTKFDREWQQLRIEWQRVFAELESSLARARLTRRSPGAKGRPPTK